MKQEISVLMDGEMFEDEAATLLAKLKQDSSAKQDWEIYHLIGDALRQPEYIHRGISEKVADRLQVEPTLLVAPKRSNRPKLQTWAVSVAATVSAIGVVAWMGMQVSPAEHPAIQQAATDKPANIQLQSEPNEYLMAHQEFSPGTEINSGAAFVRAVAYSANGK